MDDAGAFSIIHPTSSFIHCYIPPMPEVAPDVVRRRVLAVISWVLRITVLGTVAGMAWKMLDEYSPMNSLLYVEWQVVSEAAVRAIDLYGGWTLIVLALIALAWPNIAVTGLIALGIFAWALSATLLGMATSADPSLWNWFEAVAVPAHATRWIAPLALGMLWTVQRRPPEAKHGFRLSVIEWLMRLAAAGTFAAHGMEAIWQHPVFKDYLIVAAERLLGATLPEVSTTPMLYVIGGIDLLLALLVLVTRWRWVVAYMAAWGAITAGARIVHADFGAWPEFAIRFAHFGVPLALLILWWPVPTMLTPAPSAKPQEAV